MVKKLNNFRLTAFLTALIEIVGVIVSVIYLIAYSNATSYKITDIYELHNAFRPVDGDMLPQILGCFFFLSCVINIVGGLFVGYQLLPAIANQKKIAPKKIMLVVAIINGIFHFFLIALTIILLFVVSANEVIKTEGLFYGAMVGSVIQIVLTSFIFVPVTKCEFYMPEIKR